MTPHDPSSKEDWLQSVLDSWSLRFIQDKAAPYLLVMPIGVVVLAFWLLPFEHFRPVASLTHAFGALLAMVLLAAKYRSIRIIQPRRAKALVWLSFAALFYAVNCALFGIMVWLGVRFQSPSILDPFIVGIYVCLGIGLLKIPKRPFDRSILINELIDFATLLGVVCSLGSLAINPVIIDFLATFGWMQWCTVGTYFVADTALLVLMFWNVLRRDPEQVPVSPMVWVVLGGVVFVFAGIVNLHVAATHSMPLRLCVALGWSFTPMAMGFSALSDSKHSLPAAALRIRIEAIPRAVIVLWVAQLWLCVSLLLAVRDMTSVTDSSRVFLHVGVGIAVALLVSFRQGRNLIQLKRLSMERDSINQRLEQSNRRLLDLNSGLMMKIQGIFQNAPIGIYLLSNEGHLETMNPWLTQRLNLSGSESFRDKVYKVIPLEHIELIRGLIRQCLETGQCIVTPYESTLNGQTRHISMLMFPLRDKSGSITNIAAFVRDVTAEVLQEHERKAAVEREHQLQDAFTGRLLTSQENERRRIAGDLHDSLGQDLLILRNRLQLLCDSPGLSDEAKLELQQLSELAMHAITETRRISHDLKPHQLDHLGVTQALRSLLNNSAKGNTAVIKQHLENIDDLFSEEAATSIYRIVQECLANITKHSKATLVEVSLERDIHEVLLSVSDDGCGFDTQIAPPGLGLGNMHERARLLGGVLTIQSRLGHGSRIALRLPISEDVTAAGPEQA